MDTSCPVGPMCFTCRSTEDLRVTTCSTPWGDACWTLCRGCHTFGVPLRVSETKAIRYLADRHREEHLGLPPREQEPTPPRYRQIVVPPALHDPHRAVGALRRWVDERDDDRTGPRYPASAFDRFAGGGDREDVAEVVTAEDLVAVSLLGAGGVGARAVLRILDTDAERLSSHLRDIPSDVDLVDATDRHLDDVEYLRDVLRRLPGIGPVAAGRLVARKRPRLAPLADPDVLRILQHPGPGYPGDLRHLLGADDRALVTRLAEVRDVAGLRDDLPLLRVFDLLVRESERDLMIIH